MPNELIPITTTARPRTWPAMLAIGLALVGGVGAQYDARPAAGHAERSVQAGSVEAGSVEAPEPAAARRGPITVMAAQAAAPDSRASAEAVAMLMLAGASLRERLGAALNAGPDTARVLLPTPARLGGRRDAPAATGGEKVAARPAAISPRSLVVYFDFASARLTDEARAALAAEIAALGGAAARVTVNGHADTAGAEQANLRLSAQRAAAVRDFLTARLAGRPEIAVHAYGESRPARQTTNGAREAQNRRVEISIR